MKKYSPTDIISKGDKVLHNGVAYIALKSSMGKTPVDDNQFWAVYTDSVPVFKIAKDQSSVDASKYDSKAVYKLNDTVKVGEVAYRAKRGSMGKSPQDYPMYWEILWESDKPISIPKDETPDKPIVIPKDHEPITPKNISIVVFDQHGFDGKDGKDGKKGADGKDGKDGVDGKPGADGKDGVPGKDGKDGVDGVSLDFKWDGTKLGIKREDQLEFQFTDLKGDVGRALIGGGSSNKFRLSAADAVGNTLISSAKPSAAELKTLKAGSNVTLTADSTSITISASGGGGGSAHVIQDEGVSLTARSKLNFVGTAVAATDDSVNDATIITINNQDLSAYATTASLDNIAFSGAYADLSGTPTIPSAIFSTITVSGQSDIVADSATDTLTIAAGTGITITTDAGTDTLTIASSITQYTDELAQDAAASLIQNGTGISWSYNDGANTLTPTVSLASFSTTNLAEGTNLYFTDERAQDAVGSSLANSSRVTLTYNDATPSITADLVANSITAGYLSASATDVLFGRSSAGAGAGQEIACTSFARTILDDVDAAAVRTTIGAGTGNGTVTAVSVASANGFAGSSSGGATPALTLSTSVSGLLKGNGTAISAASAGTDYADSSFKTISVSGQSDVVADSAADTLTLAAGSNITITTNATTDTITISASGTGGGYATIQEEGSNLTQRTTMNFVGAGITASDDAGNSKTNITLDATLNSLASYNTNGLIAQTAADTFAGRTITGTANRITVSNGDGVSGNPTLDIGTDVVTLTGSQSLTNKTLTSPTLTTPSAFTTGGTITLAENTSIALDPAGSADGKYTGITIAATAGYTQSFGDVVYLDPTDSRWEACDANAAAGADGDSRGIIGMVVSAGTDGTACTILLNGVIRADAKFPTFTVNNPIYISETAGSVTQTQPTTTDVVIRVVGFALTADEMYFNPSPDYITHT